MPRVLVTRPEPGASATAEKLLLLGYEPVLLPLSRTASVEPRAMHDTSDFDAVAVTSANALRHASRDLLARFGGLPCLTVGARTAGMAKDAGFIAVKSADGNAEALASLIERSLPTKSRILYLCGQSRRPNLEQALDAAGYAAIAIETYRTDSIDYSPEELARMLDGETIEAILLYSPHAAARLSQLLAETSIERIKTARVLCMSAQIMQALGPFLQKCAEIAAQPDEKSLLALVGRVI